MQPHRRIALLVGLLWVAGTTWAQDIWTQVEHHYADSIPESGHFVQQDAAPQVSATLLDWLHRHRS